MMTQTLQNFAMQQREKYAKISDEDISDWDDTFLDEDLDIASLDDSNSVLQ